MFFNEVYYKKYYEVIPPVIHNWQSWLQIHNGIYRNDNSEHDYQVAYNPKLDQFMYISISEDRSDTYFSLAEVSTYMPEEAISLFNKIQSNIRTGAMHDELYKDFVASKEITEEEKVCLINAGILEDEFQLSCHRMTVGNNKGLYLPTENIRVQEIKELYQAYLENRELVSKLGELEDRFHVGSERLTVGNQGNYIPKFTQTEYDCVGDEETEIANKNIMEKISWVYHSYLSTKVLKYNNEKEWPHSNSYYREAFSSELTGYYWNYWDDGSGRLCRPDGSSDLSYDECTKEICINGNWSFYSSGDETIDNAKYMLESYEIHEKEKSKMTSDEIQAERISLGMARIFGWSPEQREQFEVNVLTAKNVPSDWIKNADSFLSHIDKNWPVEYKLLGG